MKKLILAAMMLFTLFASIVSAQQGTWISTSTPPNNAVVGGHIVDTPYPVYIGRANHNGNLHPGKVAFYNGRWSCFIGNGGVEQRYESFEILVGNSSAFAWSGDRTNQRPANAVVGGHISDTPNPVYICRANHNGNLHPGKLAFYDGRWSCFIGNGGVEQRYETYNVLRATDGTVPVIAKTTQQNMTLTVKVSRTGIVEAQRSTGIKKQSGTYLHTFWFAILDENDNTLWISPVETLTIGACNDVRGRPSYCGKDDDAHYNIPVDLAKRAVSVFGSMKQEETGGSLLDRVLTFVDDFKKLDDAYKKLKDSEIVKDGSKVMLEEE